MTHHEFLPYCFNTDLVMKLANEVDQSIKTMRYTTPNKHIDPWDIKLVSKLKH